MVLGDHLVVFVLPPLQGVVSCDLLQDENILSLRARSRSNCSAVSHGTIHREGGIRLVGSAMCSEGFERDGLERSFRVVTPEGLFPIRMGNGTIGVACTFLPARLCELSRGHDGITSSAPKWPRLGSTSYFSCRCDWLERGQNVIRVAPFRLLRPGHARILFLLAICEGLLQDLSPWSYMLAT